MSAPHAVLPQKIQVRACIQNTLHFQFPKKLSTFWGIQESMVVCCVWYGHFIIMSINGFVRPFALTPMQRYEIYGIHKQYDYLFYRWILAVSSLLPNSL